MITIIVAMGKNREIGADNQLLLASPKDLKHFKELTSGHPYYYGKKNFTKAYGNHCPIELIS